MTDDRHALAFLAAHAAGDFPLQTDWMAAEKFDSRLARAAHVTAYTAAFLPVTRRSVGPAGAQRRSSRCCGSLTS